MKPVTNASGLIGVQPLGLVYHKAPGPVAEVVLQKLKVDSSDTTHSLLSILFQD